MPIKTDAPGPALGYMYQTLYALYLLLTSEEQAQLYIEKLEDIQLSMDGNAVEALQLKHSIQTNPPNITDRSIDLWKTLSNWANKFSIGEFEKVNVLTIVTVSATSKDSIPFDLEKSPLERDNSKIVDKLQNIINEILSQPNPSLHYLYKYITSFQSLSPTHRIELVQRIRVISQSDNAASIDQKIKSELQIHPQFLDLFYEQVMGWWSDRVRLHLTKHDSAITKRELQIRLHDLREGYIRDSLPLNFEDLEPPVELIKSQNLLRFVQQLTLIGMANENIENAIRDYYRAFSERRKWLDEQVILWDEITRYERELVDRWTAYCESLKVDLEIQSGGKIDNDVFGKKLYLDLMKSDIPKIRSRVTASYVGRGSFHILADYAKPRVWWHPDFAARLKATLSLPSIEDKELSIFSIEPFRSIERINLLNPAFGTVVLYDGISGYITQSKNTEIPYGLLYLIFPLVLNTKIRESLPRTYTSRLLTWIQSNSQHLPYIQSTFNEYQRAANEALIFAINQGVIKKTVKATFTIIPQTRLTAKKYAGQYETEVNEIRKSAVKVGKILAETHNDASVIYKWFGVNLK